MIEPSNELLKGDKALEPFYSVPGPNKDILLWEGEFEYCTPNSFKAKGKVIATLLPSPSTRIIFETDRASEVFAHFNSHDELQLGSIGSTVSKDEVILDHVSPHSSSEGFRTECQGNLYRNIQIDQIVCDKVLFHLPNFFNYFGENIHSIYPDRSKISNRSGRLKLTDGAWEIILDNQFNYTDVEKHLEGQGGFGITHIGMVKRADGAVFNASEAKDVLDSFYWFLSFARGSRCGPMLSVGSLDGKTIWEPWNTSAIHPWKKGVHGWVDKRSIETKVGMNQAFKGFMLKWSDNYWRPCLQQAIHWYTEANRGAGGVEGAIALSQLALELIYWACVEGNFPNKAIIKTSGRKEADVVIRDALKMLQIPSDVSNIPLVKEYLDRTITDGTIKDGPRVISYLRNAIVHPKKEKRSRIDGASYEAMNVIYELGLNYIALALLSIIGYNGKYLNHITWQEEQVPWANSSP